MKICEHCERHVLAPEPRCPFCGTDFPAAVPPPQRARPVAAVLGLSIMLGTTACGPGVALDDGPRPVGSSGGTATTGTTTAISSGSTMAPVTSGEVPTGTETAAADEGDSGDDFGCSFYAGCPDGGGIITFECDLFEQDCPDGEKCMPWANDGGDRWNATRCSELANNPAQVGEPCTAEGSPVSGLDNCDLGLQCFGVDPATNEGTCEDMCTGSQADPICDDPGDTCLISDDGAIALCRPTCSPLLDDCAEDEACVPAPGDGFACFPTSAPDAAHGDPCDDFSACAPGQVCVEGSLFTACAAPSCCTTYCSLDDPGADLGCAALDEAQACVPWFEEPVTDHENLGACAPAGA